MNELIAEKLAWTGDTIDESIAELKEARRILLLEIAAIKECDATVKNAQKHNLMLPFNTDGFVEVLQQWVDNTEKMRAAAQKKVDAMRASAANPILGYGRKQQQVVVAPIRSSPIEKPRELTASHKGGSRLQTTTPARTLVSAEPTSDDTGGFVFESADKINQQAANNKRKVASTPPASEVAIAPLKEQVPRTEETNQEVLQEMPITGSTAVNAELEAPPRKRRLVLRGGDKASEEEECASEVLASLANLPEAVFFETASVPPENPSGQVFAPRTLTERPNENGTREIITVDMQLDDADSSSSNFAEIAFSERICPVAVDLTRLSPPPKQQLQQWPTPIQTPPPPPLCRIANSGSSCSLPPLASIVQQSIAKEAR